MIEKIYAVMPTLLLVVSLALAWGTPPLEGASLVLVASALWGFHFYVTHPPKEDTQRFEQVESRVDDLAKQLDSVRSAVNLRNLR